MKILIELPTWIGDAVMCSPAINNIISYFPDAGISLIGNKSVLEIYQFHPNLISKYQFSDRGANEMFSISRIFRDYDYFFSFRDSLRTKLLLFLLNSKKKYSYTRSPSVSSHQVERYNTFINVSLGNNYKAGKLDIPNRLNNEIKRKKIIGINPGATYGSAKRWYPEKFAKVAKHYSKDYQILLFGSKNEVDICQEIEKRANVKNLFNLAGKTSINELINLISSLACFITNDSGPMHIAAACQTPTVAIFGPTKDNETSQWMNAKGSIAKLNLTCQPCMKKICPLGHHNCMKQLDENYVIREINSLIITK